MNVKINEVTVQLPENTNLGEAMNLRGISPKGIATAVNGKVVPAAGRNAHKLCEGDNIVIIKAFYGG